MQTGLITFEVISKINGIDVDLRSIAREYGIGEGEISKEELLRIAKNAGYRFDAYRPCQLSNHSNQCI